jgi:hypothetical protein
MLTLPQSWHSVAGVSRASRNAWARDLEHSGHTVLPRTRRPQKQMQVSGPNITKRATLMTAVAGGSRSIAVQLAGLASCSSNLMSSRPSLANADVKANGQNRPSVGLRDLVRAPSTRQPPRMS